MDFNTFIAVGCRKGLKSLPEKSIDVVVTSPPYYGLRNYGVEAVTIWDGDSKCKHEWEKNGVKVDNLRYRAGHNSTVGNHKNKRIYNGVAEEASCVRCGAWKGQFGLEPTPQMYISHLVDVCMEIYRVLKNEGSFYLNIGDSYNSHRDWSYSDIKAKKKANEGVKRNVVKGEKYLQPKQLLGIPFRVMAELQNRGFILRNVLVWQKPNSLPNPVKDRRTTTWEPVFHFVKSQKYDFDLDAIRIPHKGTGGGPGFRAKAIEQNRNYSQREHPLGKNPGDILTIPTKGSPEAHYAVFPEALIMELLKPHASKICKKCGLPKKKIVEAVGEVIIESMKYTGCNKKGDYKGENRKNYTLHLAQNPAEVKRRILKKTEQLERVVGYKECDCGAGYKNKIVLDPFAGRGTVGKVAKKLGMDYILFDINQKNIEIAKRYINRSELPNYRKLERRRNAITSPDDSSRGVLPQL